MHSPENGTNRVSSVSWPRTIGKSILYGIAAAGLGTALFWGITFGYQVVESALRGNMRLTGDLSGNTGVLVLILLTLIVLTPVCVILGTITSLLLRRVALRGRLSMLRAAATGGLAGVSAVVLAAFYDIVHAWLTHLPGRWSSSLVRSTILIYIYIGAIALVVGAWYGWRMGRWLIKRGASVQSPGSGVSGSQQET